jgi:hypothetical protein
MMLAGVAWLLPAQGPISDTIKVTFPNPVIVAGERVPAGEYTIRQVDSASNPRLLEFASEDGTRHELVASAMPAADQLVRRDTSVILEQRGDDYYLRQIWIEGKDYGYEFAPSPDERSTEVAAADRLTLAATYVPEPAERAEVIPPAPTPAPEERVEVTPPPPAAPEPEERAQVTPPPVVEQPSPAPTPAPAPAAPEPREAEPLPATAAHWAGMLLAGFGLTAAGLVLRRRQ